MWAEIQLNSVSSQSFYTQGKGTKWEEDYLLLDSALNQNIYKVWLEWYPKLHKLKSTLFTPKSGILKYGPLLQSLALNLIKHTWTC